MRASQAFPAMDCFPSTYDGVRISWEYIYIRELDVFLCLFNFGGLSWVITYIYIPTYLNTLRLWEFIYVYIYKYLCGSVWGGYALEIGKV